MKFTDFLNSDITISYNGEETMVKGRDFKKEILHYFYADGTEVKKGDIIRFDGSDQDLEAYEWDDGIRIGLGTDATNPAWIESGRAFPCEYGIYPLCNDDKFTKVG